MCVLGYMCVLCMIACAGGHETGALKYGGGDIHAVPPQAAADIVATAQAPVPPAVAEPWPRRPRQLVRGGRAGGQVIFSRRFRRFVPGMSDENAFEHTLALALPHIHRERETYTYTHAHTYMLEYYRDNA